MAQFVAMTKSCDYSRMDFVCEVAANRKAVYLNFLFWSQFDFNTVGINYQQRDASIEKLREAWDFNHIPVPHSGTATPAPPAVTDVKSRFHSKSGNKRPLAFRLRNFWADCAKNWVDTQLLHFGAVSYVYWSLCSSSQLRAMSANASSRN